VAADRKGFLFFPELSFGSCLDTLPRGAGTIDGYDWTFRTSHLTSGAILMASGVMYLRLVLLIGIFNRPLAARVAQPFLMLAAIGLARGWLWSRWADPGAESLKKRLVPRNPLEHWVAFLFGAILLPCSY